MPKAGKSSGTTAEAGGELPFEEALQKLEAIVTTMEDDDLPLETLVARYEEGRRLAKVCDAKLAEAELKIQQLEKNEAGDMTLKPLSPEFSAP